MLKVSPSSVRRSPRVLQVVFLIISVTVIDGHMSTNHCDVGPHPAPTAHEISFTLTIICEHSELFIQTDLHAAETFYQHWTRCYFNRVFVFRAWRLISKQKKKREKRITHTHTHTHTHFPQNLVICAQAWKLAKLQECHANHFFFIFLLLPPRPMFPAELPCHLCVGSGEEEVCVQRKKEACDWNPEQQPGQVRTGCHSSSTCAPWCLCTPCSAPERCSLNFCTNHYFIDWIIPPHFILIGALCSFGEETQAHNYNIYNIDEAITKIYNEG